MKKLLAVLAILLSMSHEAFATAQIPETLVLDGNAKALFTNPLDPWLREPGNAEKIKPYISPQRCSASWRGYAGTWEIKNEQLMLLKLRSNPCSQQSNEIPLSVLFPGQAAPIVASWFSGRLTVPDGKQTKYIHMGYQSQYERYIHLQIEGGKVILRQTVNDSSGNKPVPNPFPGRDAPPPPRIVP